MLEQKLRFYEAPGGVIEQLREAEQTAEQRGRSAQGKADQLEALLHEREGLLREREARIQTLERERTRLDALLNRPAPPAPPAPPLTPAENAHAHAALRSAHAAEDPSPLAAAVHAGPAAAAACCC